jgi:hypothetical protein
MSTNWIDRYVAQVGRSLPQKKRADIEKEIRSLAEDMLEDRSKAVGREVDEEMTLAVLKEMGQPEKVAAGYLPEKYLVGPQLYPLFMMVLKIVLLVMAGIALFGLVVTIGKAAMPPVEVLKTTGKAVLDYYNTALQILGNLVLVFAIMQWAWPKLKVDLHEGEWNPRDLEPVEDPQRVKRGEKVWEIIFALIGLLLFNFYSQYVGIYNNTDGMWSFQPVLAEGFYNYLPWFNVAWISSILLNVVLLRRGRWDMATRWTSIGLSIFNIVICGSILMTGPENLFNIGTLAIPGIDPATQQTLSSLASLGLVLLFAMIIVLEVVKIAQTLMRMFKK